LSNETTLNSPIGLRRTLTLWDLILYGVIVIQPVAPMSVYGVLSDRGKGHVVTALLIAMVAMLFTGMSYGRMARAYPSAGSAFTYVAQEIHPSAGFITGWSMVMDYMLNPLICTVWCAGQAYLFAPGIPIWGWKIFFAAVFTWLNVRGIKTSARINAGMAAGMGLVVVVIFVAAARFIFGHSHATDPSFFSRPFYDPQTFTYGGLFGCTSIAVLTYIGFDGISTLSEEAENPRRNIMLATVLTCVVIGVLSAVEVYVAQLVWPASRPFADVNTAYPEIMRVLWPALHVGTRTIAPLFLLVGVTLLVANFGSGLGSQIGAARLLYGMGRSNALPKSFFGAVDEKHRIPKNNVLFVGGVALLGAFALEAVAGFKGYGGWDHILSKSALLAVLNGDKAYGLGAEMLNFGALIAFMGVNAAAIVRYYIRSEKKSLWQLIPPALGLLICLALWWNLGWPAKIVGSIWMIAGIAFGVWKTRWFREPLSFEVPAE
jgi:putrescine importer